MVYWICCIHPTTVHLFDQKRAAAHVFGSRHWKFECRRCDYNSECPYVTQRDKSTTLKGLNRNVMVLPITFDVKKICLSNACTG